MRAKSRNYLLWPSFQGRGLRFVVLIAAIALALASCSTGSYSKDIFQEMHYQQSHRIQEPPAGLAPPASAVSFRGVGAESSIEAPTPYDHLSVDQLGAVTENPLTGTAEVHERGQMLFSRNCQVCHGAQGDGQGQPILTISFTLAGANPPADLTGPQTRIRTDGAVFAIITHGTGEVPNHPELTNMPGFRKLLLEEERWALVHHIRALQRQ